MIPQAFTTRDVSEAYKWVLTVSPSVRDSIKTVDQLVALYLKVKRFGGSALEEFMNTIESKAPAPAQPAPQTKSAEDFQKTLKGLKVELDQFDFSNNGAATASNGSANHTVTPAQTSTVAPQVLQNSQQQSSIQIQQPPIAQHTATAQQTAQAPTPNVQPQSVQTTTTPHIQAAFALDARSKQIIHEIRESLNLGSDIEVIRMSLVLAESKLRELFKR